MAIGQQFFCLLLVLGGVAPHLMVTDSPYGVNYDLD
jgi:hypothetical protein